MGKKTAEQWRNYRRRRRERLAAMAAQGDAPGMHHWQAVGAILVCHVCGNRAAASPPPPDSGCVGSAPPDTQATTQEELDAITGVRNTHMVIPGHLVANVQPNRPVQVSSETEAAPPPVRTKRMKSDEEIKSFIINAMMQYGQNPKALLHVVTGYVTQLQELMKRDHEDIMAERACMHRHPGKVATGVYCKLCHDAEMAGKFGSIPGQGGRELVFPGETSGPAAVPGTTEDDLLDMINIKPLGSE